MSILRGLKEIDNIINEFLEPFELTAELGTDFDYCYFEDKIHYSLVISDTSSKLFMENAEKRFPNVHADIFLWSLLHEIGHSETLDDLDSKTEKLCIEIKNDLNEHTDWPTETRHMIYFDCPDEKAATDWAGEYMMNHNEEITIFWNKLKIALYNFYKLNEVR